MPVQDAETTTETTSPSKRRKASARKSAVRKAKSRKAAARRRTNSSRAASRSGNRVLREGRRMVSRAYSLADDARRAMPRIARDFRLPRRKDLHLTDANPLVVGAIGLGIGVVLGSLMPSRFGSMSGLRSASSRGRRQ